MPGKSLSDVLRLTSHCKTHTVKGVGWTAHRDFCGRCSIVEIPSVFSSLALTTAMFVPVYPISVPSRKRMDGPHRLAVYLLAREQIPIAVSDSAPYSSYGPLTSISAALTGRYHTSPYRYFVLSSITLISAGPRSNNS